MTEIIYYFCDRCGCPVGTSQRMCRRCEIIAITQQIQEQQRSEEHANPNVHL